MTKKTIPNLLMRSTLVFALAIGSPLQARAAEPADEPQTTEATMAERCKEMKEQKQKMKEEMAVHNTHLTEELAEMNGASRRKKPDLTAAVLTHTVELRIEMDEKKAKMEEEMMKHMMQHMQMGKESMAMCPMMKEMNATAEKPAVTHEGHQVEQ